MVECRSELTTAAPSVRPVRPASAADSSWSVRPDPQTHRRFERAEKLGLCEA